MQVYKPTPKPIDTRSSLYTLPTQNSGVRYRISDEEYEPVVRYLGGGESQQTNWVNEDPQPITRVTTLQEAMAIVSNGGVNLGHLFTFTDTKARKQLYYRYDGQQKLQLYSTVKLPSSYIRLVVSKHGSTFGLNAVGTSSGFVYTVNGSAPTFVTNGSHGIPITTDVNNEIIMWSSDNTTDINLVTGNLTSLNVNNSYRVKVLDVSNEPKLETLLCDSCGLAELSLENNTSLKKLYCYNNALTSLSVTTNHKLEDCRFDENHVTSSVIGHQPNLHTLVCQNNDLTTLDITGCPQLKLLYCSYNNLTSLDVSKNVLLETFYCINNAITSLNCSTNTQLVVLYCQSNTMTTLLTTNCANLTTLGCYLNNITTLDLSDCVELVNLYTYSNNIATLNVASNIKLEKIKCHNNQLTTLDISGCVAIRDVECYTNPMISVVTGSGNSPVTMLLYDMPITGIKLNDLFTGLGNGTGTLFLADPSGNLPPATGIQACNAGIATAKGYVVFGVIN